MGDLAFFKDMFKHIAVSDIDNSFCEIALS